MSITIVSSNADSTGASTNTVLVMGVTGSLIAGDFIAISGSAYPNSEGSNPGVLQATIQVDATPLGVVPILQAVSQPLSPPGAFNTTIFGFLVTIPGTYTITLTAVGGAPDLLMLFSTVVRGANPGTIVSTISNSPPQAVSSGTANAIAGKQLIIDFPQVVYPPGDENPISITSASATAITAQQSPNPGGPSRKIAGTAFSRNVLTGAITYNFLGFVTFFAIPSIGFDNTIVCVGRDSEILMADGTYKRIQHIERGDLVAADLNGGVNKVARLIENKVSGITPLSVVKISQNALGENKPSADLLISSGHPILHEGKRYRAKAFRHIPGVVYHGRDRHTASKILPVNEDNETYSLFNLQYEHDGYFIANGIVIDSIPVLSYLYNLPKELYFDQDLYNNQQPFEKPVVLKKF